MRVHGRKFKNGKTKLKVEDVLTHLFDFGDAARLPLTRKAILRGSYVEPKYEDWHTRCERDKDK